MADNVVARANTGSGVEQFATDEIGGIHYPRSKVVWGDDGTANDVSSANPLPVSDAGGSLTVDGTVALDSATLAALESISIQSAVLPTGAATEATLAALNAKLPSPGQALMAASQPVVIASNQSTIPISEPVTVLTGAAAQTAVVNNILTDPSGTAGVSVEGFRSASVQVVSTGTGGTFIFEQSNDGTNWIALPVFNAALLTGVPIAAAITATASAIIYTFPIRCRFIRLRIATLITGGSIQAFSRLSPDPWTPAVFTVAQPTAANLQATVSGTVTATVSGAGITGGTISPLTVASASAEASSAKTVSGNSAAALTNASGRMAYFIVNVSAISGAGATLTVRVQIQDPVSTGWVDLPGTTTAGITAIGRTLMTVTNLPRTYRLAWDITGTSPNITFSVGYIPVI